MPTVGNRKDYTVGRSYIDDPISGLASEFKNTAENILTENGVDVFLEPIKTIMTSGSNETMRNFFIENSCDPAGMTSEEYDDHLEMMDALYENTRDALREYAPVGSYNPVIGMSFPLQKNLLMNCIFDKGAIPKIVAKEPKFTISMENRYLVTPEGKEIDLYKNQNEITDAINSTAPFREVEIKVPEQGTTDILAAIKASPLDNLSIETSISAVKMEVKTSYKKGETLPNGNINNQDNVTEVWYPVNLKFAPSYGENDRTLMESITINDSHLDAGKNTDTISATMKKNKFLIMSMGNIKAVKLKTRIDTSSAMLQTCSVKWDTKTVIEEIPSAIPINTPVSPEEVKDVGSLYNVNQLSKIMSMFQLVLANYKDDSIKKKLDDSYNFMPESQRFFGLFDFAPREGYLLDHIEWRNKTFMDMLDTHVTNMLQVLNDPNMVITIFGRDDLIRKLSPTEYTYQTPTSIGPVELSFTKTVCTSDHRTYQFISTQKLKGTNELIIILCPRNTDRIVYRIYDYQMYISNEIRNAANYALPAIHAFERWKFVEYQPVQGRMRILNPTGLREGKDIPTLGSVGNIGYQDNIVKTIPGPTVPKIPGIK